MKSTLLTTTALIAFAGAAAAEVTFSGSATLGYNDTTRTATTASTSTTTSWTTSGTTTTTTTVATGDVIDDNQGFYWDANVAVTLSEELDNGLTAGASFDFDVADMNNGVDLSAGGFVLFLKSDTAALYYGDTAFAAETHWASAGDMEQDAFSEADGETVLRGDVSVAMVDASISMVIADTNAVTAHTASGGSDSYDQLSFGATADLGQFSVAVAYQEAGDLGPTGNGDYNTAEVFGISVGATFAGADVRVAYASDETNSESSTGVKVSYPVSDAITATAYYVDESNGDANYGVNVAYAAGAIAVAADYQDDQGVAKWGLEGSYDLGNGATVLAGAVNGNEADADFYVAGTYDLGGGASVLVSYALDDDASEGDEIGDPEYQEGTTVEIAFTF